MRLDTQEGHDCHGAIGPFPYADGSLNVMSSRLAYDALLRSGADQRCALAAPMAPVVPHQQYP
jgi:hypothetical protein